MFATTMIIAVSLVGVETGWQPIEGGGSEYIIRIERPLYESLQPGEVLTSDINPQAGEVRRYRIVIGGDQPLPKISPPEKKSNDPAGSQETLKTQTPTPAIEDSSAVSTPASRNPGGVFPDSSLLDAPARTPPGNIGDRYSDPAADLLGPRGTEAEEGSTVRPTLPGETKTEITPPSDKPRYGGVAPQDRYNEHRSVPESSGPATFPSREPSPPASGSVRSSDPLDRGLSGSGRTGNTPKTFRPENSTKPLEQQAAYKQESGNSPMVSGDPPSASENLVTNDAGGEKPWPLLMVALLGLVASIAMNVYLGWTWIDTRKRYQSLAVSRGVAA